MMECPYCKTELEEGFLYGNRNTWWVPEGKWSYADEGVLDLYDSSIDKADRMYVLRTWLCRRCNLLLANPPEQQKGITRENFYRLPLEKVLKQGKEAAETKIRKLRKLEP